MQQVTIAEFLQLSHLHSELHSAFMSVTAFDETETDHEGVPLEHTRISCEIVIFYLELPRRTSRCFQYTLRKVRHPETFYFKNYSRIVEEICWKQNCTLTFSTRKTPRLIST